jgi:hypothetical protein
MKPAWMLVEATSRWWREVWCGRKQREGRGSIRRPQERLTARTSESERIKGVCVPG